MEIAVPLCVTVAVVAAFILRPGWDQRLHPVLIIGGVHLVYNTWATELSQVSSQPYQQAVTIGAFVAFAAFAALGTSTKRGATKQPFRSIDLDVRWMLTVTCIAVGLSMYVYLVLRAGQLPIFADNPNVARVSFFPNGYTATVATVTLKAAAIAAGVTAFSSNHKRRHVIVVAICLLALGATGNRGLVVQPLAIIALFAAVRLGWKLSRLMLVSSAILLLFSVAGYQRELAAYGVSHRDRAHAYGLYGWTENFYPLVNYVAGTSQTWHRTLETFPDRIPFQNGVQFFSPLLMNESVDLYLKRVFSLDFEGFGLALGAMNAFYLDWGTAGIFIGFAVCGWFAGYVYARARVLGGRWYLGYVLVAISLVLSNYGHPFAYLATVATPILALLMTDASNRSVSGIVGGRAASHSRLSKDSDNLDRRRQRNASGSRGRYACDSLGPANRDS